jgi:divalent metal cation (Fe/Co/Zn/Cd) transporter
MQEIGFPTTGSVIRVGSVYSGVLAFFRYMPRERIAALIISAFVGHTAWHWFLDSADTLSAFWSAAW